MKSFGILFKFFCNTWCLPREKPFSPEVWCAIKASCDLIFLEIVLGMVIVKSGARRGVSSLGLVKDRPWPVFWLKEPPKCLLEAFLMSKGAQAGWILFRKEISKAQEQAVLKDELVGSTRLAEQRTSPGTQEKKQSLRLLGEAVGGLQECCEVMQGWLTFTITILCHPSNHFLQCCHCMSPPECSQSWLNLQQWYWVLWVLILVVLLLSPWLGVLTHLFCLLRSTQPQASGKCYFCLLSLFLGWKHVPHSLCKTDN